MREARARRGRSRTGGQLGGQRGRECRAQAADPAGGGASGGRDADRRRHTRRRGRGAGLDTPARRRARRSSTCPSPRSYSWTAASCPSAPSRCCYAARSHRRGAASTGRRTRPSGAEVRKASSGHERTPLRELEAEHRATMRELTARAHHANLDLGASLIQDLASVDLCRPLARRAGRAPRLRPLGRPPTPPVDPHLATAHQRSLAAASVWPPLGGRCRTARRSRRARNTQRWRAGPAMSRPRARAT